jgi:multidrug resistance efflux pump
MVGVVQADGDELAHARHRAAHARRALDQRQLVGLELAQLGQRSVAQLLGADVLDHRAQVAQLAFGIDQAGFFLAGVAIANEFHGIFLPEGASGVL